MRSSSISAEAALKVVEKLVPEVDTMIGDLLVEMAKRKLLAS